MPYTPEMVELHEREAVELSTKFAQAHLRHLRQPCTEAARTAEKAASDYNRKIDFLVNEVYPNSISDR